jgi:Tfp pilus assembly protein PilX
MQRAIGVPRPSAAERASKREAGASLLVAVLLLALMGVIGLASLDAVMRDRQVAGFSSNAQSALFAADAGIAAGLDLMRTQVVGAALAPGDCLTTPIANTTLPNAATYRPDSTAPTNQICMLASADPCAEIDASIEMGQPVYLYTVWSIRTEGVAPGGATSRVHATAERCHAFNN